jgi:transposase-like protein
MSNAGAPTKYKKEFIKQASKLASLGATDIEIADFFDVDARTLYRWRNLYPEFCQSLIVGKDMSDNRVERSLYQRAIGYEQNDVKIFMPSGHAEPVYAPFKANIAADVGAIKLWLTNRRGEKWSDKSMIGSDPANPLPSGFDIVFHAADKTTS